MIINDLKSFNKASQPQAQEWIRDEILESNVCHEWIQGILSQRPFTSPQDFLTTCQTVWRALDETKRIEMMNGHAEIGYNEATANPEGMEAAEQRGMASASPALVAQIDRDKATYRERFGFIYMIFATGKSAAEMASDLQERLKNTRQQELAMATTEFWRINQKRFMDKLALEWYDKRQTTNVND